MKLYQLTSHGLFTIVAVSIVVFWWAVIHQRVHDTFCFQIGLSESPTNSLDRAINDNVPVKVYIKHPAGYLTMIKSVDCVVWLVVHGQHPAGYLWLYQPRLGLI